MMPSRKLDTKRRKICASTLCALVFFCSNISAADQPKFDAEASKMPLVEKHEVRIKSLESQVEHFGHVYGALDSEISIYVSWLSQVTTIILAAAGVAIGVSLVGGAYYSRTISNIREREISNLKDELQKELKSSLETIHSARRVSLLYILLEQGEQESEQIFAHLTPLVANPKREYLYIFQRIVKDLPNSQSAILAQEGIEKLT